MQRAFRKSGLVLFSVAFLVSACSESRLDSQKVLASINDQQLTQEHFVKAFVDFYHKTGQSIPVNSLSKRAVLEAEFNPMVLAVHAREMGLADDAQAEFEKGFIRRKAFIDEFVSRFVKDTVRVRDSDSRRLFQRAKTYLRASHLYARSREEAWILYDKLENGTSWNALAEGVFNSSYLAKNGGDLGPFTIDDMDWAFEEVAYNLVPGTYSEPVKTAYGYSIIKVTERYASPVITENQYVNQKHVFEHLALKRKQGLAADRYLEKVARSFVLNKGIVEQVWEALQANRKAFLEQKEWAWVPALLRNTNPEVLSNEDVSLTLHDVLVEAAYTSVDSKKNLTSFAQFKDYLRALGFRILVLRKMENSALAHAPELNRKIDYAFTHYLAQRVTALIRDSVHVSESVVQEYYMHNADVLYTPLRLNLSRITMTKREGAESIVQQLREGQSFQDMYNTYSVDAELRTTGGRMGWVAANELGTIGLKLERLKKGSISEPMEYATNRFQIYKIHDRIEARPMSFEEAEPLIEQQLLQRFVNQRKKTLIAEVMSAHEAEIKWDKINELLIKL